MDLTVAMPCDLMGGDILDKTGQNAFSFGRLKEEVCKVVTMGMDLISVNGHVSVFEFYFITFSQLGGN